MKKIFWKLALILTALCLLCGCAKKEKAPTLWVVTEKTAKWNGMNQQAQMFLQEFEEAHPEFTVKLDILPRDKNARDLYFKQLRSQAMSGKGPDVYLLPTSTTDLIPKTDEPGGRVVLDSKWDEGVWLLGDSDIMYPLERKVSQEWEPLFVDIEQTMYNGIFADISEFYDADEALGKENLNQTVMNAGTYRGGRYILPIRYDLPVLYANLDDLKHYGITEDDLSGNILDLMDLAIESGDRRLAASVEPFVLRLGRGFTILSQPMDYKSDKVVLSKEKLAEFLHKLQTIEAMVGPYGEHRNLRMSDVSLEDNRRVFADGRKGGHVIGYYNHQMFPNAYPMRLGYLVDMCEAKFLSAIDDFDMAMVPLRGVGGEVTACVTYFGAVGAGCQHPEEAYEFLRNFLMEDSQFEYNRPFRNRWGIDSRFEQSLIEAGWPVRVTGSLKPIWQYKRACYSPHRVLSGINPTEADLPPLTVDIDQVSFGCVLEQDFSALVRSLNDQDTGEPADVDIDALAEKFADQLLWHVCEG